MKGTVKWFNKDKGFGFIAPDGGGKDIYFHASNIENSESITDGQRVEFESGMGRKGPEATQVRSIS